jgi:hypothetical protein
MLWRRTSVWRGRGGVSSVTSEQVVLAPMSITPILTEPILRGPGAEGKACTGFPPAAVDNFAHAIDAPRGHLSICEVTGLAMPECSCGNCIERQLEQFAPSAMILRRVEALPELADGEGEMAQGSTPQAP